MVDALPETTLELRSLRRTAATLNQEDFRARVIIPPWPGAFVVNLLLRLGLRRFV
jgi:hypothetical protein